MHLRNVEGLRHNAQKKREEAFKRTEAAIKQLIKEGRPVNFKTVAETAEVSTAWLYKEAEIKGRIEHLREQGTRKKKLVPPQQKASDASKDAKYQALKQRLQQVEAENRGLRDHLEAIHGRQRVLVEENELQRREIEQLTKLLNGSNAEIERLKQKSNSQQNNRESEDELHTSENEKPKSKITSLLAGRSPECNVTPQIQAELNALSIKLNLHLKKAIGLVSEEQVLSAIQALKEAKYKGKVDNPGGYLVTAIKEGWKPSVGYKHKTELDLFNQWYPIAESLKLVKGATQIESVQHILTIEEKWIPFREMIVEYPLEKLQEIATIL